MGQSLEGAATIAGVGAAAHLWAGQIPNTKRLLARQPSETNEDVMFGEQKR